MLTVHVRVTDAATGKPTPVRARFSGPDDACYVPFGRVADFVTGPGEEVGGHLLLGGRRFVYIDGGCEVALPASLPITIEIDKGPEYSPLRREVTLGPGQISLRFTMERWTDLRSEGWFAGDTRALELTPHAALLEGAAEGLAAVNLLARARPPALIAFSGTRPALEAPGCLVAVNTLNVHPVLGTLALLDCHRPVFPLRFGDPDGTDDWSVADWCDQCHRKRGLVVWPDLPRLTADTPQGGALAAALLGKVDAFEIASFPDAEPAALADWYRLLDCGLRLPLAGGSGKDSNAVALGAVRTYARLPAGEECGYGAWVAAVRAGHTFVTNAPLLMLTAGGAGPGHLFDLPLDGKPIPLRVEVRSATPIDSVEVLYNGHVVAAREASGNRQAAVLETGFTPGGPGWLAARCVGSDWLPDGQLPFAHTSPIWFHPGGSRPAPDAQAAAHLASLLERTLDWTLHAARCDNPKSREHLLDVLRDARKTLGEA